LSDQFTPPAVPPRTAPSAIPDDWDRTSLGRLGGSAPAPAPLATVTGGGSAAIPDDWDKTSFQQRPAAQPVAPPSPQVPTPGPGGQRARGTPMPLRPAPAQQPPIAPAPLRQPPAQQRPAAQGSLEDLLSQPADDQGNVPPTPVRPTPVARPVTPPFAPTPTAAAAAATTVKGASAPAGDFDVTTLLRSAGVDPASVPPETAASLGLILRTVVQGVVEVLQARAEVKNQFRMALTRIKTAENNPLKFSVNAEDALNSLLGRRSSAYLAPIEAFEDAFDDIRFHQMAMLAGMRAGFESVLRHFDPHSLQELFDKHAKRGGLLQMGAKARYWDSYTTEYRELTGDADDAFKRLFGDVFAEAYERQLEELKRSRGKSPR
jgi:type VI secretion system FHA domain protein